MLQQHIPTKNAHPQQRLKKWHSKVRSGCSTCRKRRVKCGEEQPRCIRCNKLGLECEYDRPHSYSEQRSSPSAADSYPSVQLWPAHWTAPSTAKQLQFFFQECVPILKLVSRASSAGVEPMSLFCDDSGKRVFGPSDAHHDPFGRYWDELLPQAAFRDPATTQLLVLMTAQMRAALLSDAGSTRTAWLNVYGKALRTMTKAPADTLSSTMTPIMACLLFTIQNLDPGPVGSKDALAQAGALIKLVKQSSEIPLITDYLVPVQVFFENAATHLKSQALQPTVTQHAMFQSTVDTFRLPASFSSAKDAREWFFRICRARPSCLCGDDAQHWTQTCAAFLHVKSLLTTWLSRLAEYRQQEDTIRDVLERRKVFQLNIQYLFFEVLLEVSSTLPTKRLDEPEVSNLTTQNDNSASASEV